MITLDTILVIDPEVVGRIIDTNPSGKLEAVLVFPARGKVKVVNEVGSRIWELTDGTRTVGEIAELICDEYDVGAEEAQRDTINFMNELLEKGVIAAMD